MNKKYQLRKGTPFNLGKWFISPAMGTATYGQTEAALPSKALEVLVYLAKNNQNTVTRNKLIDEVWGGNYSVGENALTYSVWQLRQIFESQSGPKLIDTVYRKGYKLTADVRYEDVTAVEDINVSPWFIKNIYWFLLGLTIAAAFFMVNSSDKPNGHRAVTITDLPGREVHPALSPDGKYLAFLWLPPDTGRIMYLKSLTDSAPLKQFTITGVTSDGIPTWSANSQYLVFARRAKNKVCRLFLININTAIERSIGDCTDSSVSWSPDGRWLAYVAASADNVSSIYLKNMQLLMSEVANADADIKVCCDYPLMRLSWIDMAWSADARSLAFTLSNQYFSEDIYTYSLDDKKLKQLTDHLINIKGITWTKDGRHILYGNNSNVSTRSLFQLNIDTGKHIDLQIDNIGSPVYSSDYNDLYYYIRIKDDSIGKINLDAQKLSSPFPLIDTTYNEKLSDYSAHLDKILYFSDVSGKNEIWMSNIDGSDAQQLTRFNHNASFPSWSVSGKYIAYLGTDKHKSYSRIYVLDIDTLQVKQIKTPFQSHDFVRWANNDAELLVSVIENHQANVWLVPINGATPTQITRNGAIFAKLSVDGKYLYYTKPDASKLFRMAYPQGDEELFLRQVYISWGGWDVGKKGIIYINHFKTHDQIEFQNYLTGEPKILGKIQKRLISSGSVMRWIEGENMILFTQRERQQIDIMRISDPYVAN